MRAMSCNRLFWRDKSKTMADNISAGLKT